MFSGDVEMELWPGMGLEKLLVIICKYILLIRKLQEILWFFSYLQSSVFLRSHKATICSKPTSANSIFIIKTL